MYYYLFFIDPNIYLQLFLLLYLYLIITIDNQRIVSIEM